MLLSSISVPSRWQPLISSPMLRESLRWISENADSAAAGIHELGRPGWYVNVHGCATQARDLCTWENHPETIDVQYLIEGAEGIDVTAVEDLGEPTSFKAESDTQKFAAISAPSTQVVLRPGDFAIFFPGEAHRPKVATGSPLAIRKLVVKIPACLLESAAS